MDAEQELPRNEDGVEGKSRLDEAVRWLMEKFVGRTAQPGDSEAEEEVANADLAAAEAEEAAPRLQEKLESMRATREEEAERPGRRLQKKLESLRATREKEAEQERQREAAAREKEAMQQRGRAAEREWPRAAMDEAEEEASWFMGQAPRAPPASQPTYQQAEAERQQEQYTPPSQLKQDIKSALEAQPAYQSPPQPTSSQLQKHLTDHEKALEQLKQQPTYLLPQADKLPRTSQSKQAPTQEEWWRPSAILGLGGGKKTKQIKLRKTKKDKNPKKKNKK